MRSSCVRLRLQMPGGVAKADQVPVALLLPRNPERQHDAVPDRIQLRRAGHVRADPVLPRDVRDVRGQEDVRPLPQGPLLPAGDVLPAGQTLGLADPSGQYWPAGHCVGADAPMGQ